MDKTWIDTEDGRLALAEVASHPEVRNVIRFAGLKKINEMSLQVLEMNIIEGKADRGLLLSRAELDGAKKMLKYLQDLLDNSHQRNNHPRKK